MIVDFINCLIEFTCVFTFYLTLSNVSLKKKSYFVYGFECILCSLIFVLFETPLLINIPLYLLIPCLAFPFEYKENYIFMIASFLIILYLQFMSFSVIPSTLLQTNLGNLIINLFILLFIFVLRFFSYKYKISETLSPLFLNHKLFLILFLFFSCFLGQFYLSRLSIFWTYLPGLISIIIFFFMVVLVISYVYHARSTDRLQVQLLTRNIDTTEIYITSLRMQNHDYKHHISNLRNQVATSNDLATLKQNINVYIDQMDNDRKFETAIFAISQPILRAALYGCYTRCIQNNIDFQFHATDLLPNFPLKDYQLAEILENLSSNAIEHNLTLPSFERKLYISFQSLDGHNEITISNPVKNPKANISDMLRYGYSTKDSSHSGLGLYNINQITAQNKMQFYGKITDKFVSFTLTYKEEKFL